MVGRTTCTGISRFIRFHVFRYFNMTNTQCVNNKKKHFNRRPTDQDPGMYVIKTNAVCSHNLMKKSRKFVSGNYTAENFRLRVRFISAFELFAKLPKSFEKKWGICFFF